MTVVYDVRIVNGILLYVTPALKEYTIPASVTEIASGAFDGCTELETIHIASRSSALTVQEGAFDECEKLSLVAGYADSTAMRSVLEASGVTRAHITAGTIASYAFNGCTSLTSVTIGDGVTSIGSYAFNDCTSLNSVTIPNSVTSIGDYAFSGCTAEIIWGDAPTIAAISSKAFSGYKGTSLIIPGSVEQIAQGALQNLPLESITIPFVGATKDGTSNTHFGYIFGASSYSNNDDYVPTSLKGVIITGGASIGNYAFRGCTSLTSVTIGNCVESIGMYAFQDCAAEIIWGGTPTITEIGGYAFAGYAGTSITIPDSVTSIRSSAFSGCTNIVSATMPAHAINDIPQDSLETVVITSGNIIDYGAFEGCTSLASVTISDSVTHIGHHAFAYCDSLTAITIPDSVTSIGEAAFWDCDSLEAVYITDIGKWVAIDFDDFYSSSSANPLSYAGNLYLNGELVTDLIIPDSVKSIGVRAFQLCTSLTSVTIPSSVTSIGDYAFSGCTSLASVTFEGTVAEWNAVVKDSYWKEYSSLGAVVCSDGTVPV